MEADARVWVRSEAYAWVPATIERRSLTKKKKICLTVRLESSEETGQRELIFEDEKMLKVDVKPRNSGRAVEISDLVVLTHLNEPSILHVLRRRFEAKKIYTCVGAILVAINPYRDIPRLYELDGEAARDGPHVFHVARAAFEENGPQSILISGESGAGKTETAKLILRFLAHLSKGAGALETRVVATTPVLEGMGNAKTLRNHNSSRFGKWIKLDFEHGALRLAYVKTTLLEKVRCVHRAPGERGFHVFYEVVESGDVMKKSVVSRGATRIRDEENRVEGLEEACGVSRAVRTHFFKALRCLAEIGTLDFQPFEDGSSLTEESRATYEQSENDAFAAKGGISAIEKALVERKLVVRSQSLVVKNTPEAAARARDALIKAAYAQLFDAVVQACNAALAGEDDGLAPVGGERAAARNSIGVLDIFGFESYGDLSISMAENSLEQLLINYANERLQRHFVQFVFESEKKEYEAEGVPTVDWADFGADNAATLAVLDAGSKTSLLATLDEECILKSRSAIKMSSSSAREDNALEQDQQDDEEMIATALVRRFKSRLESFEKFKCGAAHERDGMFVVEHFAGAVAYSARELVVKNMDAVPTSVAELLPLPVCAELGAEHVAKPLPSASGLSKAASKRRGSGQASRLEIETTCTRFRVDLNELSKNIDATTPHFVRCLKPNDKVRHDEFDRARLVAQLRYCGVLEAVRVARAGYAVRLPHAAFADRYCTVVLASEDGRRAKEKVLELHRRLGIKPRRRSASSSTTPQKQQQQQSFSDEEDDDAIDQAALAKLDKNVKLATEAATSVVEALQASFPESVSASSTAVGKTKVFMRRPAYDALEAALAQRRREAAIKAAAVWRGIKARRYFKLARRAQIEISAIGRGKLGRLMRLKLETGVVTMQSLSRGREERRRFFMVVSAAARINRLARRVLVAAAERRAIARARADTESAYANAVLTVQKFARGSAPRRFFCGAQSAASPMAIAIAAGRCAAPVSGVELSSRIARHTATLDAAIASRDFAAASKQQSEISAGRALLGRVWAGNRSALLHDALVVEAEAARIELQCKSSPSKNNVKSASYDEMASLDARALRAEYARIWSCPSRSALERAASIAEADLKTAMDRREFAKCATLQPRAQHLRSLVDKADPDLLVPEGPDEDPDNTLNKPALVGAVQDLTTQLEGALAAHEFSKCTTLEAKLEKAKTALAEMDADPEPKLVAARAARATAVAANDWRKAGKAQAEVRRWELRASAAKNPSAPPTPEKKSPAKKPQPTQRTFGNGGRRGATARGASVPPARLVGKPKTIAAKGLKPSPALNVITTSATTPKAVATLPAAPIPPPPPAPPSTSASSVKTSKGRTVAKLRPEKPVIANTTATISEVCAAIAAKRSDCALLTEDDDALGVAGIVTDTDVVRAVAGGIDPETTPIATIMTKSPKCVTTTDSALEALKLMVESRFRHSPVLDESGQLCGVIRISKLLNEAIEKIEELEEECKGDGGQKNKTAAMLATLASTGANNKRPELAAALRPLLDALSGDNAPTLISLLEDREPGLVDESASIVDAARGIAANKRAALAVDSATGKLTGILSSKDVMSRVVAKKRDPNETQILDAMTSSPDTISPDATLLDALRTMHDGHFLHLPVVNEENGEILGVVDALEIAYASMGGPGKDGWSTLMCAVRDDDESSYRGSEGGMTSSIKSGGNGRGSAARKRSPQQQAAGSTISSSAASTKPQLQQKPVEKLRPEMPLVVTSGESIQSVCEGMISRRTDCALVVAADGSLAGIVTDHDIAKKAATEYTHELESTPCDDVMTRGPPCVSRGDGAIDALKIMVNQQLRHLPVLDQNGAVTGVLHINRVLYEAIDKIEKVMKGGKLPGGDDDAAKKMAEAMLASLKTTTSKQSAQQLAKAIGPLIESLTGKKATTLSELLDGGRRDCLVDATATVLDAAHTIAATGRAVLATTSNDDDGSSETLDGILTPKDIMSRCVGKRLPIDETTVESVMTASPDTIEASATLLEALQQMHDERYLHLPVVDADGAIVGVVDVMEVALATMGGDGGEGWSTLATFGDDDAASDAASSTRTGPTAQRAASSKGGNATKQAGAAAGAPPVPATIAEEVDRKTVSQLRPDRQPVVCSSDEAIEAVCAAISARRTDCALLTSPEDGSLAGIVTDNDVARKAIAQGLDMASTSVEAIMTPNPKTVASDDPALDALKVMVAHRFRHLPVVDDGGIVGVLNVHRCLHAAVDKLEQLQEASKKQGGKANDIDSIVAAVASRRQTDSSSKDVSAALGLLMESLMGSGAKTLRMLLDEDGGRLDCLVSDTSTAFDAAQVVANTRRAVLASSDGKSLVGILTAKDLMNRVVSQGLDPSAVSVDDVMTPSPDVIEADATLLEALQQMHDKRFLHLPVVEPGTDVVVGIVDVMELVYSTMGGSDEDGGGAVGWSTLLEAAAADENEGSDTHSVNSFARDSRGDFKALAPFESTFTYKVVDEATGHIHRVQASDEKFDLLVQAVKAKLGNDVDSAITYQDEDGDVVVLSDDQSLVDAVANARSCGQNALKITAKEASTSTVTARKQRKGKNASGNDSTLIVGLTLSALVAIVLISSFSKR